jgi:hypothetical protein
MQFLSPSRVTCHSAETGRTTRVGTSTGSGRHRVASADCAGAGRRPGRLAGLLVDLMLRPASLLSTNGLLTPLWPATFLSSAGACCRLFRRLLGQDFLLLEETVFQDAPYIQYIIGGSPYLPEILKFLSS